MAVKILRQNPPKKHTQPKPALVPTQEPQGPTFNKLDQPVDCARKQITKLEYQLLWDDLKEKRLRAKQESGHVPGLQPFEKGTTLTLTPEETQHIAEYLHMVDGLVSTVWDAKSILRAVMEIADHAADKMPGASVARHGTVDVREAYSPLQGAVYTLELLIQRFGTIYNRLEVAERKLPATLEEAKNEAEELYASDFGA